MTDYIETLDCAGRRWRYVSLARVLPPELLARLPRSTRLLCETVARRSPEAVPRLISALEGAQAPAELPFHPGRVLMHDTTCSPALADLAAMRDAVAERGGDPALINPSIPVHLVIDHSVMVDEYGHPGALAANMERDFARNGERYRFIRWAQRSLRNFHVVPPGSGILHQVNLEHLAQVVSVVEDGALPLVVPDTLVGTDSHTPMINALGILGWGVGGIEGQAAMLGEPISVVLPRVVGVRLTGVLQPGVTATDLVLHLTRLFREHGVVDKFVEFHGPGMATLSAGDRATVSNMAPEYGSTCSYFPIDAQTLAYLRATGRSDDHVALVEAYARAQALWWDADATEPQFDERLDVDLAAVATCMAGPRQPHQQRALAEVWTSFAEEFSPRGEPQGGFHDGVVALAAITSCTNTSNPALMVAAGLLARAARRRGLTRKPWVKTSLSPGSRAVSGYLEQSGLQADLDALGFNVAGYGCMTCIGNSGSLEPAIAAAVDRHKLQAVGVISGNRNFDGRVNPKLAGAYLASPALVVAAAIAGTLRIDFSADPLASDAEGRPVHLRDLWPRREEIERVLAEHAGARHYTGSYGHIWDGPREWQAIEVQGSARFPWDDRSDYIRRPPYAAAPDAALAREASLAGMRPFLALGDNVTTDHISPAGPIPPDSVAGRHLLSRGVEPADFNQYATRRTNHEVMMRGAFSNPRLVNELAGAPGERGGCLAWSSGHETLLPPYEAALTHRGAPLLIVAGRNYGAGSSRDWAAKAPALLGVRAIVAESYERIHRSNLIGMGIHPLEFAPGTTRRDLALDGTEIVDVDAGELRVGMNALRLRVRRGTTVRVHDVRCRIDSAAELAYLAHGGVLRYMVRRALTAGGTDGRAVPAMSS